ncbi:MAG: hypothetical protein RBR97_13390 [Bacteroidales bacterium]|nr:hypothetical protein [Bacteroidales bacterium]
MKKIIFIHKNPLIPRLKNNFHIHTLINYGYNVEYWDIGHIIGNENRFDEELIEEYYKQIKSFDELQQELIKLKKNETLIFVQFAETWYNRRVFKLLTESGIHLSCLNIYPMMFSPFTLKASDRNILLNPQVYIYVLKNFRNIIYSLYIKIRKTNRFNSYFTSANIPIRTHNINNPDFEAYKGLSNNIDSAYTDKPYILFLDIFYPLHPELKKLVPNCSLIAKEYQTKLNNLFDKLEKKYGMEVIIAAHPSSSYDLDTFNGRNIIKNKTAVLVKYANYVIAHNSKSNMYAILFNKPILFIHSKVMDFVNNFSARIKRLAVFFGKSSYSIDDNLELTPEITCIESTIRENFIYSHLTSKEIEGKFNEEIIPREIEKIFSRLQKDGKSNS